MAGDVWQTGIIDWLHVWPLWELRVMVLECWQMYGDGFVLSPRADKFGPWFLIEHEVGE